MAAAARTVETSQHIAFKSILFPTDFSVPAERALPFAMMLARQYGATIHALHVLLPPTMSYPTLDAAAREAQPEYARSEAHSLDIRLAPIAHDVNIVSAVNVWKAVEDSLRSCTADLVVLGTHGRTGAQKFLLGSVAEEVFRRSPIPVLTVGPTVNCGTQEASRFGRILFATDFSPHSLAALPYATALAQQNRAFLILLHVIREAEWGPRETAAAEPFRLDASALEKIVPEDRELWCRPLTTLAYGNPAERILEVAREDRVDLVVLGLRHRVGDVDAVTHLTQAVSHQLVARASCPVLTVRA